MILKYQTLDGPWRVIDGVTDCTSHGYCEDPVIHDLAEKYDGHGVVINDTGLPVPKSREAETFVDATADGTRIRFYLVLTVHGQREHWAIPDLRQAFLMSDDGKTVDRLLH